MKNKLSGLPEHEKITLSAQGKETNPARENLAQKRKRDGYETATGGGKETSSTEKTRKALVVGSLSP